MEDETLRKELNGTKKPKINAFKAILNKIYEDTMEIHTYGQFYFV